MGFNATPNTWDGDGASNGGHRSRRGSSSRHGKRSRRRSGADKHKGGDADAGDGGGVAGNGGTDGVGNKQYVAMLYVCVCGCVWLSTSRRDVAVCVCVWVRAVNGAGARTRRATVVAGCSPSTRRVWICMAARVCMYECMHTRGYA